MLQFRDGRIFAQGACCCSLGPITGSGPSSRISLRVQVEQIETDAVVDTGGIYLVCSRDIAEFLRPFLSAGVGHDTIRVRGEKVPGVLYPVRLSLLADDGCGESLDLDVTAFVPDSGAPYDLPTMLGLTGCLERLRFAVDPTDDTFFFGAMA